MAVAVTPVDASSVVIATGLLALWMGLTDAMLKYLKPSMRPWLVLAGALLVAVGVYGIVRARRSPRRARPDHQHRAPGTGWLLVVPLFLIVLVGQQSLGAFAAGRATTRGLPPYSFDIAAYAHSTGEEAPQLQLVDVRLGAGQRGNREYLATHPVRLLGFVVPDPSLGRHGFVLTRFLVSCCAADATPIRIGMIGAHRVPKAESWVEVTAHLDPNFVRTRGTNTDARDVVMHVHSIEKADEPSGPYETLR